MLEKSESNNLYKIIEEGNTIIEAGVIDNVLRLKLSIFNSFHIPNVYIGEIRNLNEHQKLKESCDNFQEALEFFKDSKNVKFSLDDMSITLISQFGKKTFEIAKVKLERQENKENEKDEHKALEDIINRCSQKNELDNDEIKVNFEILAKEIIQLKQQHKRNELQNFKEQILRTISQQNNKIKQTYERLSQKCSNLINYIKKNSQTVNNQNEKQQNNFNDSIKTTEQNIYEIALQRKETEQNPKQSDSQSINRNELQKINEQNCFDIDCSFKRKINSLTQETILFRQSLIQKFHSTQDQKRKSTNSETPQIFSNILQQLNVPPTANSQLKLYKQQKYYNHFTFDGRTLTKIKENGDYFEFMFFEQICFNKEFKFNIKIVKSKNKQIYIGVIDYEQQSKQQKQAYSSGNAVCYRAHKGKKQPGQEKQGIGINVGEIVEVRVNRNKSLIKWFVNNQQRASHVEKILGDRHRKFCPYVDMSTIGDTIEWTI